MKQLVIALVVLTGLLEQRALGQVLITGENGGKGSQALMVSANAIYPKDYTTLANFWVQYGYGATGRLDLMASYGNITAFGATQHYVGLGSNLGLLRRGDTGLDVSLFSNFTMPVNYRNQASTALGGIALVASRPVKIGGVAFTPYGGFNTLAPLGATRDKLFTAPETLHSAIIGAAIPLSRNWIAFFEWNPGPALRSNGAGFLRVFPAK